jgi:hypothetical protein
MLVDPTLTAVTVRGLPVVATVATAVFELVQAQEEVTLELEPSLKVPVATRVYVLPTARVFEDGAIEIDCNVASVGV